MPDPGPGPDEVLIRVRACGVCRTDLHVAEGELPVPRPHVIPGHQVVGTVEAGPMPKGTRVVACLHRTCGVWEYFGAGARICAKRPDFTGWTVDRGYAEYVVALVKFVYPIPDRFDDVAAAPCLRLSESTRGMSLGFHGFGAAAHVAIQVARHGGVDVYASTREEKRRRLALDPGAVWARGIDAQPPVLLDAAIIFAPAGELAPAALNALKKGGRLILGGIHMSEIPAFSYDLIYQERVMRSVANNTRDDGREFLKVAAEIPIHVETVLFDMKDANRALQTLKGDGVRGAVVLLSR